MSSVFDSDLPDGFSEADREQLIRESTQLALAWDHYRDTITDSADGNYHHPPALWAMTTIMGNSIAPTIPGIHIHGLDGAENLIVALAAFAGQMFRFGQFCSQRGLLSANLEQCRCHVVTDDAIAQLFKDNK